MKIQKPGPVAASWAVPHGTFTKMRTGQRPLFPDRRWVGTGVGRNPCTRMRARLVSPFSDELATKDVLVHLIVFVACRCMCRLLARIVSTYCFHVLDGIDRHHLYRSIDDAWRKSCTHVVGKDRRQNERENKPTTKSASNTNQSNGMCSSNTCCRSPLCIVDHRIECNAHNHARNHMYSHRVMLHTAHTSDSICAN